MEKSEIVRILRESAGYIRGGFTKWIRHDNAGACCALGAIENALAGKRLNAGDFSQYDSSVDASDHPVTDYLAAQIQKSGVKMDEKYAASRLCNNRSAAWVADWNNYKDRTAEEIAGTMECLADDLGEP